MTISANYPTIRPSLLLDFANTEQLDPRITFSRPTTATYYDDNTSVVAEQNLIVQSQAFNNASWTKVSCTVVDNNTTAPDGTTTGALLTGTAGGYTQYIQPTNATTLGISSASTVTNTYSLYVKAGTVSSVRMYIYNNTGGASIFGTFNLTALTAVAGGSAMTPTLTITDVGNSWRRITVTGNLGGSVGQYAIPAVYADNGTFYMWGFQAEQRSSVTAYTPTTTTAITNYIPVLLTQQYNEARFDHNPTTRESLGLLIEEQRTNLLTYSSDFSNAAWTKTNTNITADTIIAPDGTLTGDKLVETATTATHYLQQSGATNGTTYTWSVYAKAGERTQIALQASSSVAYFNLSTGAVISGSGASITSVGNGWYRCSFTVTYGANVASYIYTAASGSATTTGDGFSGVYIWGAQLETGAFATSYIPTVASQVTRSADSASMTGTNFSSWYNPSQGTFYSEQAYYSTVVSTFTNWCTNFSSANNMFAYQYGGTQAINTIGGSISNASVSANTFVKYCSAYTTSSISASKNGLTTVTGAGGTAIQNQLLIGNTAPNTNTLNGYMKKLAYYPVACTNAQLQALTG